MNLKIKLFTLALASLLCISSAGGFAQSTPAAEHHGVVVHDVDHSVNPGDDFFRYSNGEWLKRTEIPADRGAVSAFSALNDVATKRTNGIIYELSQANAPAGSNDRKIADLYHSYMDESGIEAKGLQSIKPYLDKVSAIKSKSQLARALGETLRNDTDPLNNTNFHTANLFGVWIAPGFRDSAHYAPYLMQGGIVLPDSAYYLDDTEHMREIRTKSQAHISAMLKLAGFTDTDARAARILALEHAIAEKHVGFADEQDVIKANNVWKTSEFATKAPGLDWKAYFLGAGLSKQTWFYVWQPSAFVAESALVASTPLEAWKDWLAYHTIEEYSPFLPKAFSEERFAFFGKTLGGVPQQRPRQQRAVFVVNGALGDAVGQIYAKRYFPPEAKAKGDAMVANIIAAFRKRIDALTWMDPATKKEAQTKLDTLYVGMGYAEKWTDYSALSIKPDDIYGNMWRSGLFEYRRDIGRLGQAVDKHEWSMTPQTVNAVNLPVQNAMNFPAAILAPPFFDADAPDAYNYGGIGSVIGHEVSHTFDTQGSTFDSTGALRNWWTQADLDHFNLATQKLADQYDAYKAFPDLSLNGKATLAENIADVAGLAASYDAYHASLNGKPSPEQDGLTGDQQFFLAYGQTRANKTRERSLRQQIMTDSHSPSQWRVQTVRNIDAWYPTFDVQPGTALYLAPADRVRIW